MPLQYMRLLKDFEALSGGRDESLMIPGGGNGYGAASNEGNTDKSTRTKENRLKVKIHRASRANAELLPAPNGFLMWL